MVVLAAGYGTRLLADVELRLDLPQWRYLTQVVIVGPPYPLKHSYCAVVTPNPLTLSPCAVSQGPDQAGRSAPPHPLGGAARPPGRQCGDHGGGH